MLVLIGSVLILLTAGVATGFAISYHFVTGGDWWHNEGGRHIMALDVAIGMVCLLWSVGVIFRLTGYDLPVWFDWARVVVFATVPAVLLWRWRLMLRLHREVVVQDDAA